MSEDISAQEAIEIAQEFIEPYYPWRQPIKAVRENGQWIVEFDVGAVKIEIATVKVDAINKEIKEFVKAPAQQ